MRHLILILLCSLSICSAQPIDNVEVTEVPGREGAFDVKYTAPEGSVYATDTFTDTVYCAAMVSTTEGNRNVVVPMKRTDLALYSCSFEVSPLTYEIRIEICIPTDRVPDGIMIFQYKPDSGQWQPNVAMHAMPTIDSGLAYIRHYYPDYYFAYYQFWEARFPKHNYDADTDMKSEEGRVLDSIISVVKSAPANSFNKYFTLSLLYGIAAWNHPEVQPNLDMAVEAKLRDRTPESLLYDHDFWNGYYYPMGHKHAPDIAKQRAISLQRLAAAYPRSLFGGFWIQRVPYDAAIDSENILTVVQAWQDSYDVDALSSIGHRLISSRSTYQDFALGYQFLVRAEKSSVEKIGFLSGENIFGSMDRLDGIRAAKVRALIALGRGGEAVAEGEMALAQVSGMYGTQQLTPALAEAMFAARDIEGAKQQISNAIGGTSKRTATVLDSLFAHDAKPGETRTEYIDRLLNDYEPQSPFPVISNFFYTTLEGKKGSLAELRGKLVFIDFWFLGCAGCALEHHSLNEFARRFKSDTNLVFLSIALNDANTLRHYLKTSPLLAEIIPDGQSICDAAKVTGFPTHTLIDEKGRTILWEIGGSKNSGDDLTIFIADYRNRQK